MSDVSTFDGVTMRRQGCGRILASDNGGDLCRPGMHMRGVACAAAASRAVAGGLVVLQAINQLDGQCQQCMGTGGA